MSRAQAERGRKSWGVSPAHSCSRKHSDRERSTISGSVSRNAPPAALARAIWGRLRCRRRARQQSRVLPCCARAASKAFRLQAQKNTCESAETESIVEDAMCCLRGTKLAAVFSAPQPAPPPSLRLQSAADRRSTSQTPHHHRRHVGFPGHSRHVAPQSRVIRRICGSKRPPVCVWRPAAVRALRKTPTRAFPHPHHLPTPNSNSPGQRRHDGGEEEQGARGHGG